jgi:hypothetical protein
MAEVFQFAQRKRKIFGHQTVKKVIDGQTFEFVNLDALSPEQRRELFSRAENGGAPEPLEPWRAV